MSRQLLKQVHIAAPCNASWHSMKGDDRVRFCGECKLNVYNISEMSVAEATNLIKSTEGRLCVRMFQRPDGTVLSKNCPVGLAAIQRRLAFAVSFVFAIMFGGFGFAIRSVQYKDSSQQNLMETARSWPVVGPAIDWLSPRPTMGAVAVTGKLAVPPPVAATSIKKSPSSKP